ncbi:MAG: ATP-binding cassette domain-containing protein [Rhodospirillales bacterium]|nr:ATP-binding cassette domain-containing protein [Rhodospirillales bacterium]
MAPPLLTLRDIHLTFGGHPLLEGAEFSVFEGDRICLVGRNGSGKSTLLKIAAGQVEPDDGERFLKPGVSVGYLPQEPDLSGFATVLAYVEDGLLHRDDHSRAYYLLAHLGLSGEEDPATLSGGETRRAALARALAPEPDVLMLDEPTNHLDLPAIEWLEKELNSMRSALVLISHDRRFLSQLTRATLWVYQGEVRRLAEGFSAFEAWRDGVLENIETERHKLDRKIVRELHWLSRGVTARRKRNMGRLRALDDLRQQRRNQRSLTGTVTLAVTEGQSSGKLVAELEHVSKAYGDNIIVKDLNLRIQRGDRLGLVGPNGAGKTTLIKLITGELKPDTGTVRLGTKLEMVTLDQKRESLDPRWTLSEALTEGSGDSVHVQGEPKHVVGYMKDFLFGPEQKNTPIEALSGGERGRLMLARALAKSSNLLVLDEPTNDLDLETLDLLQEMLNDYAGTVLLVSHDRDFLDRVATSVLAFEGEGMWQEYPGGYSDMVDQRGRGVETKAKAAAPAEKPKDLAVDSSLTVKPSTKKLSYKDKYALETLPGEMEKLRAEIALLQGELKDPAFYRRNPTQFKNTVKALDKKQEALNAAEERWLELELLKDEIGG